MLSLSVISFLSFCFRLAVFLFVMKKITTLPTEPFLSGRAWTSKTFHPTQFIKTKTNELNFPMPEIPIPSLIQLNSHFKNSSEGTGAS